MAAPEVNRPYDGAEEQRAEQKRGGEPDASDAGEGDDGLDAGARDEENERHEDRDEKKILRKGKRAGGAQARAKRCRGRGQDGRHEQGSRRQRQRKSTNASSRPTRGGRASRPPPSKKNPTVPRNEPC